MTLNQWVMKRIELMKEQGDGIAARKRVVAMISKRSGVACSTIEATVRGANMSNYQKARDVSKATDWEVSVIHLCDPDPEETIKRINAHAA